MKKKSYFILFAMLMLVSSTMSALPPGDYSSGCFEYFENPLDAKWDTVINCDDGTGSVSADATVDKLHIDASSATCLTPFEDRDFWNGIISAPVSGDFEVVVKAEILTDSNWEAGARGGIILGRNVADGSGIAAVHIRPKNNEYRFYYDSDGDGTQDGIDKPGTHDNTSWLKISRNGNVVSAYTMCEGLGETAWQELGTHDIGYGDQPLTIALVGAELAIHFDSLYMSTCPAVPDSIFTEVAGGTATVTTTPADKASVGTEVIVDITNIEAGKGVDTVTVNDTVVVTEVVAGEQYSFNMPADTSAHVNVTLEDIPVYTINTNITNGTATVTTEPATEAPADSLVTITIEDIEAGKVLDSVYVDDIDGTPIDVTEVEADSVYSYTMPAKAVTVTVALKVVSDIEKLMSEGVDIYPNPVNDILQVSSETLIRSLKLSDIGGAIVLQNEVNANAASIDMTGLSAGNYLLQVVTESGNFVQQVVKK